MLPSTLQNGLPGGSTEPMTRNHRRTMRLLGGLFAVTLAFHLWSGWFFQLVPDEAYYWVWSRHPAMSYFDHPPMVAWLIGLSTRVLGQTELGVRFFAAVLAVGAVMVVTHVCRRTHDDPKAALYLAAIWLCSPMLTVLAAVMTPDTPAIFFSTCALAALLLAIKNPGSASPEISPRGWVFFGFFTGLALLSKYTAVLLPAAVVIALAASPAGRRQFRRPWIYLAGLIAALIFSPVIAWNAAHHWASFAYQLNHGTQTKSTAAWQTLPEYIAGQALVWNPIFFVMAALAVAHFWRQKQKRRLDDSILLCAGVLPLALFAVSAMRTRVMVNWPDFAYIPLSLLTAKYLAANWGGERRGWAVKGCIASLVITLIAHAPGLLVAAHIPLPPRLRELYGWRELGSDVAAFRADLPILCTKYQDASELTFYTPGHPDAWAIPSDASHPTAFEYFEGKPDIDRLDAAVHVGNGLDAFCKLHGFTAGRQAAIPLKVPDSSDIKVVCTVVRRGSGK